MYSNATRYNTFEDTLREEKKFSVISLRQITIRVLFLVNNMNEKQQYINEMPYKYLKNYELGIQY